MAFVGVDRAEVFSYDRWLEESGYCLKMLSCESTPFLVLWLKKRRLLLDLFWSVSVAFLGCQLPQNPAWERRGKRKIQGTPCCHSSGPWPPVACILRTSYTVLYMVSRVLAVLRGRGKSTPPLSHDVLPFDTEVICQVVSEVVVYLGCL